MTFYEWVKEEARLIHADGCSGGTNLEGICCLIHDLEFYYGKSVTDAYSYARLGHLDPWMKARPVTYDDANRHFRSCMFRESTLGYLNPRGWLRYWAVRTKKGRAAWDGHRQREAQV
jgi:hypothetical protein